MWKNQRKVLIMKILSDFWKNNKNKILVGLYLSVLAFGVVGSYYKESLETFSMPVSKKNIVIDAGHGNTLMRRGDYFV